LRGELANLGEILGGLSGALVLDAKQVLEDGQCLLQSRDGLLVLLELAEQSSEVVQRGRVLRMVVATQFAVELNSFLEACNGLAPLVQCLVANGRVVQEQ
jgi:hypothetical protein